LVGSGRRGRNRTCNPRIRNPMLYPFELRARVESTGLTPPDVVETSGLCRFCAMFPLETFRAAVDRAACPRESIAYRRNIASDVQPISSMITDADTAGFRSSTFTSCQHRQAVGQEAKGPQKNAVHASPAATLLLRRLDRFRLPSRLRSLPHVDRFGRCLYVCDCLRGLCRCRRKGRTSSAERQRRETVPIPHVRLGQTREEKRVRITAMAEAGS
jgi:hypothetical protein